MNAPLDWPEQCEALAEPVAGACAAAPVAAGPAVLAREIAARIPRLHFREVLCRGGWHRIGGVVGPSGERFARNVEEWATGLLAQRDGDFAELAEDFAGSGLRMTRISGRTHILVAPVGAGPGDFLQLEIEELQEVAGDAVFDGPRPPSTLDELVDPRTRRGTETPMGTAWYALRRIVHVGDVLERARAPKAGQSPADRFLDDWAASSAHRASVFCNHWVLAIREHLDRYRQNILHARPLPALQGAPAPLEIAEGTAGLCLQEALVAFDRRMGYPFAWYFHMLTTKAVPFWVARQVVEDARAGYAYLPERDFAAVRGWLRDSYAF